MTTELWTVFAMFGFLSLLLVCGALVAVAKAKETVRIEINLFNF